MSLTFHERVGHEGRRPSPFSWRIRYALAHKRLLDEIEIKPTRFSDVEIIRALSGQHFTPIIVDDGRVVHETWNIAEHLEARYPDRPSLFGGPAGQGLARMLNSWTDIALSAAIRPLILTDFINILDAGDRPYFRQSREKALGMTLEAYCADQPQKLIVFQAVCEPLERTLAAQPFLAGASPTYADYCVFSVFQMARLGSPHDFVRPNSAIEAWRRRMIGLYGNIGDSFASYPGSGSADTSISQLKK